MKNHLFTALFVGLLFIIPSSAWSQYVTNGDATDQGGDCFRLTQEFLFQAGSVWFQNKVTLNANFHIEGTVNLGTIDEDGADGIAFVLQPVCSGLGSAGGGLGYLGISPSLACEFDTWQNVDVNDPPEDHIALMKNGDINHVIPNNLQGPFILSNLENGNNHSFIIDWNAGTNTLQVTLDGTPHINYSDDIVSNIFSGNANVFWGFTGATGGSVNNQTVCITSVSFTEEGSYTVTSPTCPDYENGAVDLNPAGGVGPFTYAWSNGETTKDISGLSAGIYSVTITDNNGCETVYSIEVTNEADTEPPIAYCRNITVEPNPDGTYAINPDLVNDGSSDNCGIQSVTVSPSVIPCFHVSPQQTVTLTVTDVNGNSSTCTATVTLGGDDDCDGVGNFCDLCPGGNDQIDNNNDGFPDCDVFPGMAGLLPEWKCGNNNTKVLLCHIPSGNNPNKQTLCISPSAVQAHLNHGCYVGPCDNASCTPPQNFSLPGWSNGEATATDVNWDFEVFPNPANTEVSILLLDIKGQSSLQIYDAVGRKVWTERLSDGQEQTTIQLDEHRFSNGMYTVLVNSAGQIQAKRLMIMK